MRSNFSPCRVLCLPLGLVASLGFLSPFLVGQLTANWRQRSPIQKPSVRTGHAMAHHPTGTVLFGGDTSTGEVVPFAVDVPRSSSAGILWGRARWLPDGSALAFIGVDEHGISGVFRQDFLPGQDTSDTRRALAGFSSEYVSESFTISPDGRHLALSGVRQIGSLMLAEGLPGVEPPRRDSQ